MSPAAVNPACPDDQITTVPSTESPAPRSLSAMLDEIIRKHWRSLEASHKASAWGALEGGYSDARRAYHSWEHIAELLEKLDEFRALSAKPELVATAVFWHDAVYATRAPDGGKRSDLENVRDSAELFLRHTLVMPVFERVYVENSSKRTIRVTVLKRKRCFSRELCTLSASIPRAPSIFPGSFVSSSKVTCLLIEFTLSLSRTSSKSSPFAICFIWSPIFPNLSERSWTL